MAARDLAVPLFAFGIAGDRFKDVNYRTRDVFERIKDEELEVKRRCLITSTNIAKIIGHNPYSSKQDLLLTKLGNQVARGTRHIQRGNQYENEALALFSRLSGIAVRVPVGKGFVRSKKHNFLATSPDAMTLDGRLVEVKVPLNFSQGIPLLYIPQLQFSMYILGCRSSFYVEYNADKKDIRWKTLDFDEKFIEKHLPAVEEFARVVFTAHKDRIDSVTVENLHLVPGKTYWRALCSSMEVDP